MNTTTPQNVSTTVLAVLNENPLAWIAHSTGFGCLIGCFFAFRRIGDSNEVLLLLLECGTALGLFLFLYNSFVLTKSLRQYRMSRATATDGPVTGTHVNTEGVGHQLATTVVFYAISAFGAFATTYTYMAVMLWTAKSL